MNFVIIFGPPAVGKMTVGRELARLTGMRLFHNHMTIELVLNFFNFGEPPFYRLVGDFRRRVFEEVAASELPGLIFTYVWAFDLESEKEFIDRSCEIFRAKGGDIYFVELEADISERLERNATESRLAEKPSKRNVEESTARMLEDCEKHKLNTNGDFYYPESHIKIDNTNLRPEEAARMIVEVFQLPIETSEPRG